MFLSSKEVTAACGNDLVSHHLDFLDHCFLASSSAGLVESQTIEVFFSMDVMKPPRCSGCLKERCHRVVDPGPNLVIPVQELERFLSQISVSTRQVQILTEGGYSVTTIFCKMITVTNRK